MPTKVKSREISMTFAEARKIWEDFYMAEMPPQLTYYDAAHMVLRNVGSATYVALLNKIRKEAI